MDEISGVHCVEEKNKEGKKKKAKGEERNVYLDEKKKK